MEQVLGYEHRPEAFGLVATLWHAARAFVIYTDFFVPTQLPSLVPPAVKE
jgi:hypothetical protein